MTSRALLRLILPALASIAAAGCATTGTAPEEGAAGEGVPAMQFDSTVMFRGEKIPAVLIVEMITNERDIEQVLGKGADMSAASPSGRRTVSWNSRRLMLVRSHTEEGVLLAVLPAAYPSRNPIELVCEMVQGNVNGLWVVARASVAPAAR